MSSWVAFPPRSERALAPCRVSAWAASAARNAQEEEVAVLNLSSLLFNSGDAAEASQVVDAHPHLAGQSRVGVLVRGVRLVIDSTTYGSVDELIAYLADLQKLRELANEDPALAWAKN